MESILDPDAVVKLNPRKFTSNEELYAYLCETGWRGIADAYHAEGHKPLVFEDITAVSDERFALASQNTPFIVLENQIFHWASNGNGNAYQWAILRR